MNPWTIIGALVALIVVGASSYLKGEHDGENKVKVAELARENTELTASNAKIQELQNAARSLEAKRASETNAIAVQFEKDKKRALDQKDRDHADALAGAIKLRFATTPSETDRGAPCTAGATAGSGNGGTTAELPRKVTDDLLALANDADAVVVQLTACQAVITSDRKE